MTKKYLYFALLPLLLTSCNSSNTSQSAHDDEDNSGVIKEDVTIDSSVWQIVNIFLN